MKNCLSGSVPLVLFFMAAFSGFALSQSREEPPQWPENLVLSFAPQDFSNSSTWGWSVQLHSQLGDINHTYIWAYREGIKMFQAQATSLYAPVSLDGECYLTKIKMFFRDVDEEDKKRTILELWKTKTLSDGTYEYELVGMITSTSPYKDTFQWKEKILMRRDVKDERYTAYDVDEMYFFKLTLTKKVHFLGAKLYYRKH